MKNISSKSNGRLIQTAIFVVVLLLIQTWFNVIHLSPLKGAISQPVDSKFTFSEWFSGTYQEQKEVYLNETFGLRSFFIRLNNQLSFSLFDKAKANGVIIGKENYLFEENYIKAYYGTDYIGIDSIAHRMEKLKFIQDTLNSLNKDILLVFAAGKGSYYPEYFPDQMKTEKGITNYETHLDFAKKLGIKHIDFNRYFVEQKNKSVYPLYPQYGIHWSYYGMCLAADSIIRNIEMIRNIDMPNLFWTDIEMGKPKMTDSDIADGLNILFKPRTFKMAYPNIQVQDDQGKIKPSVLVVSDSYYWGMFNFGITRAFSTSHFWFYNKEIYPESFESTLLTSQVSLKDEIAKHDVIVIMATEATLPGFGWGFIENTYNYFKGINTPSMLKAEYQMKIDNHKAYIKTDANWMKQIEEKAILNNVSVDSMLTLDAIWLIEQDSK